MGIAARLASVDAARGKPALFLTTGYELYAGNLSEEELLMSGCELCGFNLGVFEQKIVAGIPGATGVSGASC